MGDGKPVEVTSGTPKDVAGLRQALIGKLSSGINQGATKYGGQLSAGVDPMQTAGADMISKLMGYGGYKSNQGSLGGSSQWSSGGNFNPGVPGAYGGGGYTKINPNTGGTPGTDNPALPFDPIKNPRRGVNPGIIPVEMFPGRNPGGSAYTPGNPDYDPSRTPEYEEWLLSGRRRPK
jgi:hypothetical protein